ncbi:MAG: bifunctional hydroxymethylpyrimidine kinase/phosphomethylpyrimidine kinase, partial [Lachnospiraceae bacterium]|nr:bifunctional hydroxymethylpyrimidine kinase/phosphomethylpyrimidine kinase [Lachnospiraceae bacterium]
EQIEILTNMFREFKTDDNVILVDPVMADNGKLYPAFDEAFAAKMAKLCGEADIIVPNITEASFMTGMEYKEKYDEAYIKEMLLKLSELGAKISVLTGVSFKEGTTGVMGYDKENDEFYYYSNKLLPKSYHGTGDVFASTTVGAMMNGFTWKESLKIAADFTAECIRITMEDPNGCWYGVNFETAIPYLLKLIGKAV